MRAGGNAAVAALRVFESLSNAQMTLFVHIVQHFGMNLTDEG
jgi:hypothetical protein